MSFNNIKTEANKAITKQLSNLLTVSIIIPVYNAEKNIDALIKSLLNLDYPKELLEIILIDNNSLDKTREIIKLYQVKLLEEKKIQSSYASRNKGIKNAKNEIIAFTDSDCIVTSQWIREGVKAFVSESADLVGGKVEFVYSKHKTAAELYDSITNIQTESNIKDMNAATTANLFVKSSLFERIGLFPDSAKSGGDIRWTSEATGAGFRLVYAPNAIVKHPTRRLKELLKKNYRVGTGIIEIYISMRKPLSKRIFLILRLFLPQRFSYIRMIVNLKGTKDFNKKLLNMWCVAYLCNISKVFGILSSLSNLPRCRNKIKSNRLQKMPLKR
jgi:cellulose synthase/poly-beta-1,6-N-acetylglucosamine synthase-like glycosyltransferase